MKLHKLLYLLQRESIIRTGAPMFNATFQAWKYGPVIPEIRTFYKNDQLHDTISPEIIENFKEVFDFVFAEYAGMKSFVLSNIKHGEYCGDMPAKDIQSMPTPPSRCSLTTSKLMLITLKNVG